MRLLSQVAQDARYSLRAFRHSKGFAVVAVATLALGLGVNTAIFSVINTVLLRPLPYRDPATLVLIDSTPLPLAPSWLTAAWREHARSLTDLAGFNGPRAATLVDRGISEQIDTADVTWNFLSLLGVVPEIGRDFAVADADQGAPPVALLSYEFWQRAFGGDRSTIGSTVTVTGKAVTIVGVTPAGFRFPTSGTLPATRMPTETQPDVLLVASAGAPVSVIGRLATGDSSASARAELRIIFKQAATSRLRGAAADGSAIGVAPLHDRLVGNVRQRLWLLMGAVSFVLLVACSNIASLLLARSSARQRELAVRLALGATRGRVTRLLLIESLVLAFAASVLALGFAFATRQITLALLADRVAHVAIVAIDLRVLGFNLLAALLTGVFCAVISVPGARQLGVAAAFTSATPAVTGRSQVRRMLLSAETAITFVLVVGAALLAQTFWNLTTQDRGFDADRLLTVRVAPGLPADLDRTDRRAGSKFFALFFGDLQRRFEALPGVVSAAAISLAPLEGTSAGFAKVAVNGRTVGSEDSVTPVAFVTPQYFATMRIPLLRGRDFTDNDRFGNDLVAIVNEEFRRRFSPNTDIIGTRITSGSGPEAFTVIGVSQDVPDHSLRQAPEPLLVAPLAQMPGVHISWASLTFVLRTVDADPLRLTSEVRRTIWAVNPNIVINEIATMKARVAMSVRNERDSALLFGLFAVTALMMAAIGIYGMAAYTIVQRTKEIGIRVALGAARGDVRRLVLTQTLWPTLIGIALGVVVAAALARLVASMVFGVATLDLTTFVAAAAVLLVVALAASWAPARRAVRIDPLVALRYE